MNNLAIRGVFGMVVSVSTAGWLAGWLAGGNRCMTDDDNDNETTIDLSQPKRYNAISVMILSE